MLTCTWDYTGILLSNLYTRGFRVECSWGFVFSRIFSHFCLGHFKAAWQGDDFPKAAGAHMYIFLALKT